MSKDDCIRIRVSSFTPKAFSMRRAISPERSDLAFRRLERAGRDTPRTCAAAVTERPCGSMISIRINSPGCGGFSMRMATSLVVILQVHFETVACSLTLVNGSPYSYFNAATGEIRDARQPRSEER